MFSQEAIEWPEEVEILMDRLEGESVERELSREERALMDVYETNPLFPALRSGHRLFQRPSHRKQIPSSQPFELYRGIVF